MRPVGPTFWLLNGRIGFRTGVASGIVEDAEAGLRLAASSDGPLALAAEDGSLGRLVLPSFAAIDGDDRVYLLTTEPPFLRRFEPEADRFVPLAETAGIGRGSRDVMRPVALAAGGRNVLVADRGMGRVLVFDTHTLALRAIWQPASGPDWQPISVWATERGEGWVLDATGVVRHYRTPADRPQTIRPIGDGRRWVRLAVDRTGLLHLLDADGRLQAFHPTGEAAGAPVTDRGPVADRFPSPPIVADHRSRIAVPDRLRLQCPEPPSAADQGSEVRWYERVSGTASTGGDDDWLGPRLYQREGLWISEALDSQIHRCQWHRIQLELGHQAPGSRIRMATLTADEDLTGTRLANVDESRWETIPSVVSDSQPDPRLSASPAGPAGVASPPVDAAIASREGRFLWLRIELTGDGYTSPTITAARVHYPRRSDIELLPAIFSADDTARRFTERFLSLMRTQLEPVEDTIRNIGALFDPAAAPPQMVDVLAAWFDLQPEPGWTVDQRRHVLEALPPNLRSRGTPAALRAHVRASLENLIGSEVDPEGFPRVVEGFRRRDHVWLGSGASVGDGRRMWSDGAVARIRLDQQREGPARLVSTGDPDRDVFHHYAHTFRMVMPAAWVRNAHEERLIRRAIDAEKPAHTSYELDLLTPGIRIGGQSTVGIDTIVGAIPQAKLACRHDDERAPSRPPENRLGVDTVLCGADPAPRPLRAGDRIGENAVLI